MSNIRSRRPITIDEIDANRRTQNINYVLRRYGGLNVYVPRFPCNDTTGCLHRPSSNFRGSGTGNPQDTVQHHPPMRVDGVDVRTSESSEYDFPRNLQHVPYFSQRNPFGKFSPLFGGRIVLGPGKAVFITCFLFFIALLIHIILEKDLIERYCGGFPVFVVGGCLAALNLLTFFIIGITDPGVVPKNFTLQELLMETEDYRSRHPAERYFRYCNKCRTCRPPRTFHCSRCEICVRQQETHLWATGTCVGERNRRSYFFFILVQTLLGTYLLVTNLLIASHVQKGTENFMKELLQVVTCAVAGTILLFFPQSGIFMLMYRLYLIGVGRTAREEYRKYHCYNTEDCFVDDLPLCINIRNFFCRKLTPSVFRRGRNLNRVDPEVLPVEEMPTPWILEQMLGRHPPLLRDSQDLIMRDLAEPEEDEQDILNANRIINLNENLEAMRLREVANYARGKSTPSVPLFEHGLNPPMTRIRMPRKSKQSTILKQQIVAHYNANKLPKVTVSNHKRQKLPVSLSDGCIPRTKDGLQEMIQLSRATQLRRIIQMILLRDREGLMEMSNRVNIAALVGMNRFDPDNLQLLELNNGLPMIAPRRREPEAGGHRLGAGVLGIPQMVAAGLLPTARDLANSVETMVGRGRIRRLPPVGRQRYTPITVVGAPAQGPRRVLNMDDDIQITRTATGGSVPQTPQNSPYGIVPPQMTPSVVPPQTHQRVTIPFPVRIQRNNNDVDENNLPEARIPTPLPPPVAGPVDPNNENVSDDDDPAQGGVMEQRFNNLVT